MFGEAEMWDIEVRHGGFRVMARTTEVGWKQAMAADSGFLALIFRQINASFEAVDDVCAAEFDGRLAVADMAEEFGLPSVWIMKNVPRGG